MRYLVLLALLVAAGCDTADPVDGPEEVALTFAGLDALGGGFHYEGWVILDGEPLSTGKFDVDGAGRLVDLDGASHDGRFRVGRDLSAAAAFVLTIEPAGDVDAVPAATKLLGGDFSNGGAALAVSHGASLGDDFGGAAGTYILATPTDGAMTHETSGIWFLDPSGGAPAPGLDLPALPDGWSYEGWVVIDGQPVTTGTFTVPDAADAAAPFSGAQPGPPFPGEDFLTNAPAGLVFPTDLSGATAVISVEPVPDDSPAPFTLKPLVGPIPTGASDHTPYAMSQNTASLPTGTARLR